jgi:tetratricopeptide (TPR) repeat protein
MTSAVVDPTGEATRKAWEADGAISRGETHRARELYREAAELLEARLPSARKHSEKAELRFLVASQYYHGGHYGRAAELVRKIDSRLLAPRVRRLFERFVRDVKERSSSGYTSAVRRSLLQAWEQKDPERVFELLQSHPYILPPSKLAFLRAICSEELKDYQAAAIFYADSFRFDPTDVGAAYASGGVPMSLIAEGKLAEAWSYVKELLPRFPHFIPKVVASLLRFNEVVRSAEPAERQRLLGEQIQHVRSAWESYQQLPTDHQGYSHLNQFMALGLEAASLGLMRSGDKVAAAEMANRAVAAAPAHPGTWTMRGVVTYPGPGAVADFREAVRLGERCYPPYYFLAHDALIRGDWRETASWCERALQRDPSPKVAAQLYEWLAIARANLGAASDVVRGSFANALRLDPDNARIHSNAKLYEAAARDGLVPPLEHWDAGEVQIHSATDLLMIPSEEVQLPDRQKSVEAILNVAA